MHVNSRGGVPQFVLPCFATPCILNGNWRLIVDAMLVYRMFFKHVSLIIAIPLLSRLKRFGLYAIQKSRSNI